MSAMPPSKWRWSQIGANTEYCSEVGTGTRILADQVGIVVADAPHAARRTELVRTTRTEMQARQASQAGR
jgi:hypothetical protein